MFAKFKFKLNIFIIIIIINKDKNKGIKQKNVKIRFLKIKKVNRKRNIIEKQKAKINDSTTVFPAINWIIGIPEESGNISLTSLIKFSKFSLFVTSLDGKISILSNPLAE